jgi:peptidoglycan/LPS O-acetylase OafA/YrhL
MTNYSSPIADSLQKHHKKYRPDIDGLRAVAVLCVVIFHGFPSLLPGGFVGVDIFFVMSGFLISTILFESLIANKFSFFGFYLRRAKRIFPSLIVILVVCYIVGWNVLFPSELRGLSKHIFGGSIFLSNFVSFLENGYFDVSADFKPLLHLWSLGIEEQFYIIWPLVLWLAWKKKSIIKVVIIAAIVFSFALNIITVNTNSNAAFYLPHMRFWELLIGSLLAYLTIFEKEQTARFTTKYAHQLSVVGAALLIAALLLISKDDAFPGWWALLPTLATAALIMAGPQAWVNQHILSRSFMIWFGLISFPLYLWHWPLLSFARILFGDHVTPQIIGTMMVLSVALAWLTYKFVETPIRFGKSEHKSYYSLTAILAVIGVVGLFSFKQEGKSGLPRDFLKSNQVSISGYDGGDMGNTVAGCGPNKKDLDATFSVCTKDKREEPKYVLLGDSKALALFPGLVRTSEAGGRWALVGGNGIQGPVAPILSDDKLFAVYQKSATAALDKIVANPGFEKIVIVAATRGIFSLNNVYSIEDLESNKNYDVALAGVKNFTKQLLRAGKPVIFVIDNPTFKDPDQCLPRKLRPEMLDQLVNGADRQECRIKITDQVRLSKKYRELLEQVRLLDPALISILDTTDTLCDTATGYCSMTKNGRLVYGYTDHVSDYGAGLVGQTLNAYVNRH